MNAKDIEKIEIELLLQGIQRRYGYDFHHYARASLKRRLRHRMHLAELKRVSEMLPKVLHDEEFFADLLADFSITVTDFFRDPQFYRAFRLKVVPTLKTYPFVKIWHAGCSTAEEVYSMAILLHEEGFLERTQIYATDFNTRVLGIAEEGIYPLENFKRYSDNYLQSGGTASLMEYFHVRYESGKVRDHFKDKITFANHNLVTDSVFGEMNAIICRNVLIYFDQTLQNHVLALFADSLCNHGILCLGTKESLAGTEAGERFQAVEPRQKIYRKKATSGFAPLDGCEA